MANKVQEDSEPQILVLKGPPACGKTTWAMSFVNDRKDWMRVNRDDLRKMSGDYWTPYREQVIKLAEITMIEEGLRRGFNIIIDDTNLKPETLQIWHEIASKFGCKIKEREFIVPYEEAVKRDEKREKPVGADEIRLMYKRFYPDLLQAANEI